MKSRYLLDNFYFQLGIVRSTSGYVATPDNLQSTGFGNLSTRPGWEGLGSLYQILPI